MLGSSMTSPTFLSSFHFHSFLNCFEPYKHITLVFIKEVTEFTAYKQVKLFYALSGCHGRRRRRMQVQRFKV